ncbi:hypothetical protein ACFFLS_07070 [Flavobacterium procerum]|uniref:Gliding motility-associated protein GldM N-terminal domain-containing protein n=1 Tax=Flavobacterium procerum TaxID=1455569 RepID=A0ABV6BMX3_9FLAO
MKKIIILLFIVLFSSCKENNEAEKLMYNQLVNCRDELKMYSATADGQVDVRIAKEKTGKNILEERKRILLDYERSFEKLKFEERDKLVKLRDSFNEKHRLQLHFDTSNYNHNVPDTVFKIIMEIDFYRLKISFQNIYLLKNGYLCI